MIDSQGEVNRKVISHAHNLEKWFLFQLGVLIFINVYFHSDFCGCFQRHLWHHIAFFLFQAKLPGALRLGHSYFGKIMNKIFLKGMTDGNKENQFTDIFGSWIYYAIIYFFFFLIFCCITANCIATEILLIRFCMSIHVSTVIMWLLFVFLSVPLPCCIEYWKANKDILGEKSRQVEEKGAYFDGFKIGFRMCLAMLRNVWNWQFHSIHVNVIKSTVTFVITKSFVENTAMSLKETHHFKYHITFHILWCILGSYLKSPFKVLEFKHSSLKTLCKSSTWNRTTPCNTV